MHLIGVGRFSSSIERYFISAGSPPTIADPLPLQPLSP
jgi:hypothetical protein